MTEVRRQVLFVCTGNTCRSPLAAALGQAWLDRNGIAALADVVRQEGMGWV